MQENRVRRNITILIGVTTLLLIGIVLGWYFVFLRPQKETYADIDAKYQEQKQIADELPQAVKDQKKAEDHLKFVQGQLAFFRQRYRNLYFGEIGSDYGSETTAQRANREAAWRRWMNTYYSSFGPALTEDLLSTANSTGVIINADFNVQPPPKAPEEVIPPGNGLLKPVSSSGSRPGGSGPSGPPSASGGAASTVEGGIDVSVTGSLSNILDFFSRLNTSTTLMNVGTIVLDSENTVPARVKASFRVTPYLLATGPGAPIAGSGGAGTTTRPAPSGTTTASTSTGADAG